MTFPCPLTSPTPITLWQQNLMPRGVQGGWRNAQPEDPLDSPPHAHSWHFNSDIKNRAEQGNEAGSGVSLASRQTKAWWGLPLCGPARVPSQRIFSFIRL